VNVCGGLKFIKVDIFEVGIFFLLNQRGEVYFGGYYFKSEFLFISGYIL
jgi:hypothetical protein